MLKNKQRFTFNVFLHCFYLLMKDKLITVQRVVLLSYFYEVLLSSIMMSLK